MFGLNHIIVSPSSSLKALLAQFKNRGRIGIVVDILDTVQRNHPHGQTKTQIMRGAGLSYEQTCRYLEFLTLCDMVRGTSSRQGAREFFSYHLTPRGFELVKQLYSLHMTMKLVEQKFV